MSLCAIDLHWVQEKFKAILQRLDQIDQRLPKDFKQIHDQLDAVEGDSKRYYASIHNHRVEIKALRACIDELLITKDNHHTILNSFAKEIDKLKAVMPTSIKINPLNIDFSKLNESLNTVTSRPTGTLSFSHVNDAQRWVEPSNKVEHPSRQHLEKCLADKNRRIEELEKELKLSKELSDKHFENARHWYLQAERLAPLEKKNNVLNADLNNIDRDLKNMRREVDDVNKQNDRLRQENHDLKGRIKCSNARCNGVCQ